MKIEEILRTKGHDVFTIAESQSLREALQAMVDRNIGSLVVMAGRRAAGILTERDILRFLARTPGDLSTTGVAAVMTREMITAEPQDQLTVMMDVMTEKRIRHLPVMERDRLVGIISIGDLVNACRVSAERENRQLREYIQGAGGS